MRKIRSQTNTYVKILKGAIASNGLYVFSERSRLKLCVPTRYVGSNSTWSKLSSAQAPLWPIVLLVALTCNNIFIVVVANQVSATCSHANIRTHQQSLLGITLYLRVCYDIGCLRPTSTPTN